MDVTTFGFHDALEELLYGEPTNLNETYQVGYEPRLTVSLNRIFEYMLVFEWWRVNDILPMCCISEAFMSFVFNFINDNFGLTVYHMQNVDNTL